MSELLTPEFINYWSDPLNMASVDNTILDEYYDFNNQYHTCLDVWSFGTLGFKYITCFGTKGYILDEYLELAHPLIGIPKEMLIVSRDTKNFGMGARWDLKRENNLFLTHAINLFRNTTSQYLWNELNPVSNKGMIDPSWIIRMWVTGDGDSYEANQLNFIIGEIPEDNPTDNTCVSWESILSLSPRKSLSIEEIEQCEELLMSALKKKAHDKDDWR